MSAILERHRLTVDDYYDYYKMAEVGILQEDGRIELIEGELIDMAPMGSLHAGIGVWLEESLRSNLVGQNVIIRVQKPLRLNDTSPISPSFGGSPTATEAAIRNRPRPIWWSRLPIPR